MLSQIFPKSFAECLFVFFTEALHIVQLLLTKLQIFGQTCDIAMWLMTDEQRSRCQDVTRVELLAESIDNGWNHFNWCVLSRHFYLVFLNECMCIWMEERKNWHGNQDSIFILIAFGIKLVSWFKRSTSDECDISFSCPTEVNCLWAPGEKSNGFNRWACVYCCNVKQIQSSQCKTECSRWIWRRLTEKTVVLLLVCEMTSKSSKDLGEPYDIMWV